MYKKKRTWVKEDGEWGWGACKRRKKMKEEMVANGVIVIKEGEKEREID
jgi:hypothetical protein